jgi:hypothetical protein
LKKFIQHIRQGTSRFATILAVCYAFLFACNIFDQQPGTIEVLGIEDFFLADGEIDFVATRNVDYLHGIAAQKAVKTFQFIAIYRFVPDVFQSVYPIVSPPGGRARYDLSILYSVFRI